MHIVWFRQDLRLNDNPALVAAAQAGKVLPCYILDDVSPGPWKMGGASRWWLHGSLTNLIASFKQHGVPFILRSGSALEEIPKLAKEVKASGVYWNRNYEPATIKRDQKLKKALQSEGIMAESFKGSLLFEPWEIQNKQGHFFKVFTPFWKHCLSLDQHDVPLSTPKLQPIRTSAPSEKLDDWHLTPHKPDWAGGLRDTWTPGEAGAGHKLQEFLSERLNGYKENRNIPSVEGTSMLSPHLHFGEISPRTVRYLTEEVSHRSHAVPLKDTENFLSELGWREFSYHLLYHFPELPTEPFNAKFGAFPWHESVGDLVRWQQGQTGYPIVDAGMRELWHTGYMHNRVRMIVASFLTKDLLIPWQRGAEWFWDTLVDADLANNSASWQWVAGCGADAAPYFRIFNPSLQGEKFDPEGDYVRQWVPELKTLPKKYLHKPWEAPDWVLKEAAIRLGSTYPKPMIDHGSARDRALKAYKKLK